MTSEEKETTEPLRDADDVPDRLSREEMVDQLGVMARRIAGDAPPAIREASVRQEDGALAEASGAEVVPAEATAGADPTGTDEETAGTAS